MNRSLSRGAGARGEPRTRLGSSSPLRRALNAGILAALLASSAPAAALDDSVDLGALEVEADLAADAGDYGRAAAILRRARSLYPGDPRPAVLLGNLFTDRSLHSLALDEYLAAEALDPSDLGTLQLIADTYGYLNRLEDSIRYLRRILAADDRDTRALGDLGWMLFKTHRHREGVELLTDAERRLGSGIGFSMTLGTLKAELFEYDESLRRYNQAIAGAVMDGFSRFAAVGYYNLSLLESRFRNWDRALEAADASIRTEARSSGYLARGELRLRRMELGAARADFTSAFGLDTTPLARLALAEAAIVAGNMEEADTWLSELIGLEEHPWMANFGTDPDSFAMDLYALSKEIHAGRAGIERARPKRNLLDAAASLATRTVETLAAAWNERLFRKRARAVAGAYAREGAELLAQAHGFLAFRRYPRIAGRYLAKARALEEAFVPEARVSNDLEAALLARDPQGIEAALAALDPVWERNLAESALSSLANIRSGRGGRGGARSALERLWLLNPGALPRLGHTVPAVLILESASGVPERLARGV
ncbi:MAG TPA: hypothetical protein VLH39_06255, partial [Magnetospirillaceae bacterium]|nr:hypothetical protein [Magnetospirillaceae bacterium]